MFLVVNKTDPVTTASSKVIQTTPAPFFDLTTEATSSTSNTTTSTSNYPDHLLTPTTTSVKFCRPNSEEFTIDQRKVCLEFEGLHSISEAASLCSSKQGKLPLPTNQKENDDYVIAFITVLTKIGLPRNGAGIPLDLNDIVSEGNFVTSTGKAVEWFNWREGEPNNSDFIEDYVEMFIFDDSFTETEILTELSSDLLIQIASVPIFESSSGKWNVNTRNWQVEVFCEYDQ